MAATENLIDFDVIEGSKENIQQLPSGRSAKALHAILSPVALKSPSNTQDIHNAARQEFEAEIIKIEESDDPLDVFDRYVKWTVDAYPSAQATPQSQLLPLLERATKTFLSYPNYKNDARYLKMWLLYIRFFSDAPRETFAYLARHNIGETLALYYEEFAAWLEGAERWNQAREVYQLGLGTGAQPSSRLTRRFADFEKRYQARPDASEEPSSPAIPTVRPALATKAIPFATPASPSEADPQAQSRAAGNTKSKKSKLAIFSDNGEDERPASGDSSRGWDNIGSIAERKKENVMHARPMAGETMKSSTQHMGVPKMAVFKDESKSRVSHLSSTQNPHPLREQRVANARTGRLECVFVNLEAIYPNPSDPSEEYSFEELRAAKRGWLQIDWHARRAAQAEPGRSTGRPKKSKDFEIRRDDTLAIEPEKIQVVTQLQTLALNDEAENAENIDPAVMQQKQVYAKKLARKEEKANRTKKINLKEETETKTVQTNLNSPAKSKVRRKKSKEATMTLQSKLATDEVYELFNKPMEAAEESEYDSSGSSGAESSDVDDDDDDDYTSGGESVTGRLSAAAGSDYGEETQRDLEGEATTTGWTTFDPRAILAGREHELDDTTTHTQMTSNTRDSTCNDVTASSVNSQGGESDDGSEAEMSEAEIAAGDAVTTPTSPHAAIETALPTRYVPLPPEGWEAPQGTYRDPAQMAQNRLPFMTPIVEKTESSLGMATGHRDGDYFGAKTPCPKVSQSRRMPSEEDEEEGQKDDELMSSPFEAVVKPVSKLASPPPKFNIPQPQASKDSSEGVLDQSLTQPQENSLAVRAKSSIPQPAASKPAAREPAQKGPIIRDSQLNPMDDAVRATILREMHPPISSYDGYHHYPDTSASRRTEIKRACKAIATKSANVSSPVLSFPAGKRQFTVKRELGAGAYAPVYLVESTANSSTEEKVSESAIMGEGVFSTGRRSLEALKMEDPPSAWEFYIISLAHRRLGVSRAAASIVRAHEMHLFADECYLVEDYRPQGTLLDLVNQASKIGVAQESGSNEVKGVDEVLAMWFASELLRTVEALHAKGIMHGDLKPDNVLLRLDADAKASQPESEALSTAYRADGSGAWASRGIALIDFGRGINMAHFGRDVQFVADWATTATDCAEMREARPWTWQIDYFGVANCLHTLLFGRYIETVADKNQSLGGGGVKSYRLREPLKRYWQTDIWADVFAALLNPGRVEGPGSGMQERVSRQLRACRERIEAWLEANGERGVGLRGLIRRVEGGVKRR